MREGDIVLTLAGVAHQNRAKAIGLAHAVQFANALVQLLEERGNVCDAGEVVGVFAFRIFDDVWMI